LRRRLPPRTENSHKPTQPRQNEAEATNAENHDQKVAHAAAVQIVPQRLVHHEDRAVTVNVVHEATDLKQVGQRDQNEVTETRHAIQVVAVRKHHQNPAALVEVLKKADAALARIADIARPDRKLVKTVLIADDRVWIAVQDIAPLSLLSEDLAADAPILMLTNEAVDQVIDHRCLAHKALITDHSLVHTAATSVMRDPASDIMPVDTAVIIPGSTHDTVRCTTADLARRVVITDHSSVRTADTSVTVDPTSDIMPADMVVIIPGSTHDKARCTTDLAHKAVITDHSSVHTAGTSARADPTLDIMPADTAISSAPILVHVMVARCPDIISVHEMATMDHISAHAV
jgi:hypothetical protein